MSQARTYRAWGFACFYYGALVGVAAGWLSFVDVSETRVLEFAMFVVFVLLGLPFIRAKVEIGDEGITQRVFRCRFVRWREIVTWKRITSCDSDGLDVISITTRAGSFTLSHNIIHGKRLDEIESELKGRTVKPGDASRTSQTIHSRTTDG